MKKIIMFVALISILSLVCGCDINKNTNNSSNSNVSNGSEKGGNAQLGNSKSNNNSSIVSNVNNDSIDLTGKYVLESCSKNTVNINCEEIFKNYLKGTDNYIEFKSDNTFTLHITSVDESGIYETFSESDNNSVNLTTYKGYKMFGSIDKDKISINLNNEEFSNTAIDLIFKR